MLYLSFYSVPAHSMLSLVGFVSMIACSGYGCFKFSGSQNEFWSPGHLIGRGMVFCALTYFMFYGETVRPYLARRRAVHKT